MAPYISLSNTVGRPTFSLTLVERVHRPLGLSTWNGFSQEFVRRAAPGLNPLGRAGRRPGLPRPQDRYREAPKVEPEVQHLRSGHEPVEEPSHEGTHHPEEHGDYAPAGVATRHQ